MTRQRVALGSTAGGLTGRRATSAVACQQRRIANPPAGSSFTSRPVSRVLSGVASATAIHLGRPLLDASSNQPGRRPGRRPERRRLPGDARATPIWSCSRWGLPCHDCRQPRGALLPHPFTLARRRSRKAVCFLWHFPWGRPRRPLAATVFPWSPDFPPARRLWPWPVATTQAAAPATVRPTGEPGIRVKRHPASSAARYLFWMSRIEIPSADGAPSPNPGPPPARKDACATFKTLRIAGGLGSCSR